MLGAATAGTLQTALASLNAATAAAHCKQATTQNLQKNKNKNVKQFRYMYICIDNPSW